MKVGVNARCFGENVFIQKNVVIILSFPIEKDWFMRPKISTTLFVPDMRKAFFVFFPRNQRKRI